MMASPSAFHSKSARQEPMYAPSAFDPLAEAYEERAAILEFDGGLSRTEAEALAMAVVFGAMDQ